jgi:hypothetical protein
VHETPDDLAALQQLLDDSDARGGPHLRSIITPERRLTAQQLSDRLVGMRLLALATVTADGRPIVGPVDGIFYRFRHIRARPQVSATHLPGEELAVTLHGRAVELDMKAPANAGFRQTVLDVYTPRYGTEWEQFLDSQTTYARIDAERMFTFSMPENAAD